MSEMINLADKFEEEISNKFNLRIKELEERIEDLEIYNKLLEDINDNLEKQNNNFIKRNNELEDKNNIFESTRRCYKQLQNVNTNLINENEDLKKALKITLKNNQPKDLTTRSVSMKQFALNGVSYYMSSDNIFYDREGNPQEK
jgi:chromosome segregation ATPase